MRHNEDALQKSCVSWFGMQYPQYRLLLHHSPNGGYRTAAEGAIFKAMGTRAGFPDLILLLPSEDNTMLAIEFKTKEGRQSDNQREWQRIAERYGIRYEVVREFLDFKQIIDNHIQSYERNN